MGVTKDSAIAKQERLAKIVSFNGQKTDYEKKLYLPMFIYAQTKKGEIIGRADYIVNGELVDSVPIILGEEIFEKTTQPKQSIFDKIKKFLGFG